MYYRRFFEHVLAEAKNNWRDFPWRKRITPYRILVSEIMLQQTQVGRVGEKFENFVRRFRSFRALAKAPLRDVLKEWQGLGYNRRALYLKRTAEIVVRDFGGKLPSDPEVLITLPGIGKNTAGALCAFAFNNAVPFIETNIRTVFIHHFFAKRTNVHDKEIFPLIEKTLDHKNPRTWYWALMDAGASLKKNGHRLNDRSAHYVRQSKFKGSNRELRGKILRALNEKPQEGLSITLLQRKTKSDKAKLVQAVNGLKADGLVREKRQRLFID